MRIVLSGGGTGGHFYPLVAVSAALREVAESERILTLEQIFMAADAYDAAALAEAGISYEYVPSGKLRRYWSLGNFTDMLKTFRGIASALWRFTLRPPDVVFSKGGYESFPILAAARLYRIPVFIHESDAVPGAVNQWAGRFAKRIGVSFPETLRFFNENKTAYVGHPLRRSVLGGSQSEAMEMFDLESGVPVVLVLGGSQGSKKINDTLLEALSGLVDKIQIIHSAGPNNFKDVSGEAEVILERSTNKKRYHVYPFLNPAQLRNASFVAGLCVSRAGGGSIFEIAAWGVPAILIPLPGSAQDHQRENAYSYARVGAAIVMEESNLTLHLLASEILKTLADEKKLKEMKQAARAFARPEAAQKVAEELIRLGLHD